jgi:hypothetical protein
VGTGEQARWGGERIGPWGLGLLAVAGVIGLGLAVHGSGQAFPAAVGSASLPGAHSAGPSRASGTGTSTTTTAPASAAPHQKLGPLLSSTQYASYAYRLYPGARSSQARLALAGFTVHVTPGPNTITVSVSAAGSSQGAQTSTYPAGDRVYFIEASFGDDSGDLEYNGGDDGLIVTNSAGRIVQ